MRVAVETFDGFNEVASFVVAQILNRLRPKGSKAFIGDSFDFGLNSAAVSLLFFARARVMDQPIEGSRKRTPETP
jgi:hypothetical protein